MDQTSFNTWTLIFLIAAFQGCLLSFILWKQKKDRHPGKNFLAILVALFSVMLMYYVSFWTGYNRYLYHFDGLFLTLPFSFGPIILAYQRRLTNTKISPKFYLHFIPFGLQIIWVLLMRFLLASNFEAQLLFNISNWILSAQAIHVLIYSIALFREKNKETSKNVRWKSFIKIGFLLFAITHASYYAMVNFGEYVLILDYFISISMSVFIYGLAYSGLRFSNIQQKRISEPLLTKASTSYYSNMLIELMEKEKLYLDGELKLESLSKKLSLNKHALSQLLNSYFNKNFSDFVNSYRIKEAEKLLNSDNHQDLNVVEIAYRVGFNTKASFYNAFRKKNQISPREYRILINDKSTSIS